MSQDSDHGDSPRSTRAPPIAARAHPVLLTFRQRSVAPLPPVISPNLSVTFTAIAEGSPGSYNSKYTQHQRFLLLVHERPAVSDESRAQLEYPRIHGMNPSHTSQEACNFFRSLSCPKERQKTFIVFSVPPRRRLLNLPAAIVEAGPILPLHLGGFGSRVGSVRPRVNVDSRKLSYRRKQITAK